ncbi:hypothetical protein ACFPA8_27585 [Streptomyces ovatisporus]|uniref:HNH endonuclease n=1 Tax=Streptomyces ovatisporus TaxID=1128682 RepID=A0ABV9AFT5_9ACTN
MRTHRTPIVGAKTWEAVMNRAGWQCQCTGSCNSKHTKTGGRCHVLTGGREDMLIAPSDLLLSDVAKARVPEGELLAWCDSCHRQATTKQRKAQSAETAMDGLFALEETTNHGLGVNAL